jgi:hypothetical protein
MTIDELLQTLPEEERAAMRDFLCSRTPCRFETTNTAIRDIRQLLPEPSLSSLVHQAE